MTLTELTDLAVRLSAWTSLAGVAAILAIFALYEIEDRANQKDDQ